MDFLLPAWLERQFSHQENMELELNGCWIRALEQGVLNPINIEHQHLLDVVTGKAEPSTLLEQTWLKYKKLSANGCPCEVCAGVGYYDNPKNWGKGNLLWLPWCRTCWLHSGTNYSRGALFQVTQEVLTRPVTATSTTLRLRLHSVAAHAGWRYAIKEDKLRDH